VVRDGKEVVVKGERWRDVKPEVEGRFIDSMGGCNKLERLESSSIEVKRPTLFHRASLVALMSVLTSASISVCLVEEEELNMNIYPQT
jgi:hypothetical protein